MLQSGFSFFVSDSAPPAQWSQSLKPRLTRNDVMSVSDHPLEFILKVSRGAGFTQFGGLPIPVRTTYPLTEHLYKQRRREPWPELGKAMVTPSKSPEEHDSERDREAADRAYELLERFAEQMES